MLPRDRLSPNPVRRTASPVFQPVAAGHHASDSQASGRVKTTHASPGRTACQRHDDCTLRASNKSPDTTQPASQGQSQTERRNRQNTAISSQPSTTVSRRSRTPWHSSSLAANNSTRKASPSAGASTGLPHHSHKAVSSKNPSSTPRGVRSFNKP